MFLSCRLSNGNVLSGSVHFGPNECHLPFLHPRCLHDNDWVYTRAAEVLALPKVRSGIQAKMYGGRAVREWDSGILAVLISQLLPFTSSRPSIRCQTRPFHRLTQDPENTVPTRNPWVSFSSSSSFLFSLQSEYAPVMEPGGLLGTLDSQCLGDTHLPKGPVALLSHPGSPILFIIKNDISRYVESLQNPFETSIINIGLRRRKGKVREGQ